MADLRDFLQSMSNSAASNVSAPVDGINWLMRKSGLPVSDAPFMGSDWMAQKGFTKPVKQGAASVLGETAGMLAPMAIAAKAPQIARGLLQAEANAMAPRTLNPQTGAIVWHGSPHKFDKFDSGKIGTGEGAQAYGHGLYLAESPEVSKTYMRTQMGNAPELEQMALRAGASKDAANTIAGWYHQTKDAKGLDKFLSAMREPAPSPYIQQFRDGIVKEEPALRKAWENFTDPGQLYKVDLPDDQIARMLDWDKPLSQQSNEVQKALTALKDENGYDALQSLKTGYGANFQGATGQDILRALERNTSVTNGRPEAASSFLKKQGIPGIRYLDGGSRGAGQGSSNFVVFPGNEDILKIMERNGKGLLGN